MANFQTPFASTGPRRTPNADEKANGFPCGAADQTLFNGMFHRIEAELGELITFAGLVPTDAQYNQVRLAVQALIAAATGGGEAEDYVLIDQLAARIPIFPEVQTADGKMNITSPANGTIRMPGGINFLHRGVVPHVTVQTDFNTVSSRTYHLRWNPTDGYQLKHLGDNTYNPDGLAEDNVFFDSTFDSMLIARVITNAGNVPTITPLANKDRMDIQGYTNNGATPIIIQPGDASASVTFDLVNQNWARRPRFLSANPVMGATATGTNGGLDGKANQCALTATRYKVTAQIGSDFLNGGVTGHYAYANWSFAV